MLKRFEVENFKGFKDTVILDLTARDYAYNKYLIENGIVNKGILYGKNGTGKTSLGIALFDIIGHLTDKERIQAKYIFNYKNLDSSSEYARFKYFFQFGNDEVIYEYYKRDYANLISEQLTINGKLIVMFNYDDMSNNFVDTSIKKDLNIELVDNRLSVLKYVYRNTPTDSNSPFNKMMTFCENMLWYRGLSDGNTYCGFTNGGAPLAEKLYESGKLKEFETFLKDNGLNYKLKFESVNGIHELLALFGNNKKRVQFSSVASSGTMALFLFFIWSITSFEKLSFLFIDEFDAFFHYESAEYIIKRINENHTFQSLVTSHNTYLMQNKLTRPDCCFIQTFNKISALYKCTDKEIREAHNLEKMYVNGVFNE